MNYQWYVTFLNREQYLFKYSNKGMSKRNINKKKAVKSKRPKMDDAENNVKELEEDIKDTDVTKHEDISKVNDVTKDSSEKEEKSEQAEERHVATNAVKGDNESKKDDVIDSFDYSKDWIDDDSYLIYNPHGLEASNKVAAFDVDSTLIITKSGNIFPKTWDDFKVMLDEIPEKLQVQKTKGYKLVIVTNQDGIRSGKVDKNEFKKKMLTLLKDLGVTMQIFVATDMSVLYRKPNRGFFDLLQDKYNSDVKIDLSESFYVGDAAGRPDNWAPGRKKDFSCSDRLFALNCGIGFHTPEEYFLNENPAPYDLPSFCPSTIATDSKLTIKYDKLEQTTHSLTEILPADESTPVLIILIGSPGSGKSHFCVTHLVPIGFTVINQIVSKSVPEMEKLLKEKKRVVIDNRNAEKATRKKYVTSARKAGVEHILFFVFDISNDHCRHNGKFRELTDPNCRNINDKGFKTLASKYQVPNLNEKCTGICKISDLGISFESEEKKGLFCRYLNDT